MDVAFRNPDGSTVLVAHNENDDPRSFAVAEGDASFDYTLPGGALATFVWPKSQALDNGLRLLPADGMSATATTAGPDGQGAGMAVDDDASTRYTTGQRNSRGRRCRWMPAQSFGPASSSSIPDRTPATTRAATVSTSLDGATWSAPVTGSGAGQLTSISLPHDRFRYFRIVQTGTAPNWWSVADLRIYG